MRHPSPDRLERIAARGASDSRISSMSFRIEQPSTGFVWEYGDTRRPFFIASITKLHTAAIIMQLREESVLTFGTPAADLLGEDTMRGLNVHGGRDHGPAITVGELLAHTSGLPDYFEQKHPDGTTVQTHMLRADRTWTLGDLLERSRALPSPFPPSTPGRAHYSDLNYDLLGRIIEVATSSSWAEACRARIITPLGLGDWALTPDTLERCGSVAEVRHSRTPLHAPKALASQPASGGIVSTPADQVRFLRAFIAGELFPGRVLSEMTARWNSVFSRLTPLACGIGIMQYRTPPALSPFMRIPAMIGHSGSFGTVLYHSPELDLHVSGTVNQMRPRSLPYPILTRLVAEFR